MGKGGTKFEGDAIGVRGKAKVGLSGKEMRRNMVRAGWGRGRQSEWAGEGEGRGGRRGREEGDSGAAADGGASQRRLA